MNRIRVGILSVVPSPYQRDLFSALSRRDEFAIGVYYMERNAPDSPWPEPQLESHEKILPGFWLPIGSARCHFNRGFPALENFDVFICNTLTSWTAQSLLRSIPASKPWVFWGERQRDHKSPLRHCVQEWLSAPLRHAAAIVGVGSRASADYQRRFPGTRHFSIPYYCDIEPFIAARNGRKDPDQVTFLFCGQMIRRKGIDILLDAFSRLCRRGFRIRLLLVGREAELPGLLAKLPVDVCSRVEYGGFLPPKKLPSWFSRADIFVLPSRYEGWGVVVNQALGAGLPIICSDAVGAGDDLVEEGVNGSRVTTGSVEALAQKMQFLVENPDARKAWGAASARKSRDWIPEAGAARWAEVIEAVTKKT
jgi:glycosyltransferase involved in cell wall biosynthesis